MKTITIVPIFTGPGDELFLNKTGIAAHVLKKTDIKGEKECYIVAFTAEDEGIRELLNQEMEQIVSLINMRAKHIVCRVSYSDKSSKAIAVDPKG